MKLASFVLNGRPTWGAVASDGVVDLKRALGDRLPTLRAALAADALAEVQGYAQGRRADARVEDVTFLPVIPDPDKIVCVGLNYEEHRIEANRERTDNPALFLRVPGSQVGHGQPILVPREST